MSRCLLAAGLMVASGCSANPRASLPEIAPDQFTLTLEADAEALGRGGPTEVVHRLSNESGVAVCLARSWELRLAGEAVLSIVTAHQNCSVPLIVVGPGEQAEWRSTVELGRCLGETELGFLPPLRMRCGAEVPLEIEISVFRWSGTAPEWGATQILSRPLPVVRWTGRSSGAASGQ